MGKEINKRFLNKIIDTSAFFEEDEAVDDHYRQLKEAYTKKYNDGKNAPISAKGELIGLFIAAKKKGFFKTLGEQMQKELASLTGLTEKQAKVLFTNHFILNGLDCITESGEMINAKNTYSPNEYTLFDEKDTAYINAMHNQWQEDDDLEDVYEDEEDPEYDPERPTINEYLIVKSLIKNRVPTLRDADIESEIPSVDAPGTLDKEVGEEMHTYFKRKLAHCDSIANNDYLSNKRDAAQERLEIYYALKQRSENRSWGDVFKHPWNTFQEWILKNSVKSTIQNEYKLSENALDEMEGFIKNNVVSSNFHGYDKDGNLAEPKKVEIKDRLRNPYTHKLQTFIEGFDMMLEEDKAELKDLTSDINKGAPISQRIDDNNPDFNLNPSVENVKNN